MTNWDTGTRPCTLLIGVATTAKQNLPPLRTSRTHYYSPTELTPDTGHKTELVRQWDQTGDQTICPKNSRGPPGHTRHRQVPSFHRNVENRKNQDSTLPINCHLNRLYANAANWRHYGNGRLTPIGVSCTRSASFRLQRNLGGAATCLPVRRPQDTPNVSMYAIKTSFYMENFVDTHAWKFHSSTNKIL